MPRKPRTKREPKQKQTQKQIQQVIVNLAEQKPKRRRAKRAPRKPAPEMLTREFPKTIYQSVPVYIHEDQGRYANLGPIDTTSILRPERVKSRMPILEDLGTIGTEGFTEILDVPTKREQLADLITPVEKASETASETAVAEPYGSRGMIPRAIPKSAMFPEQPKEREFFESESETEPSPSSLRKFVAETRQFKTKAEQIRDKPKQKRTRAADLIAQYNNLIGYPPLEISDYNEMTRKQKKNIKDQVERAKGIFGSGTFGSL